MISHSDMTAVSILALGPENKDQISSFVGSISESVENGDVDCLALHIQCKAWIEAITQTIGLIEAKAMNEALLHAQKSFEFKGAKVEIRELGTKWNFEKTNDFKLAQLASEKQLAAHKEKDRMEFLKALKEKETILNEETGEVVTIYPPYKTSKTGLVITL